MTTGWLTALQAKRDEFYVTADKARDAHEWDTQAHYFSMAMGISAAISAVFDTEIAAQHLEHKRVSTS